MSREVILEKEYFGSITPNFVTQLLKFILQMPIPNINTELNLFYRGKKMKKPVYGPSVGTHLGKPIYKSIESDGIKYEYDRKAECDTDGCPLQQLGKNEMLFNPGLIYKQAS